MENIRYNISPCAANEVSAFIGRIDVNKYVPNGEVKATERSHYDRYSYLCDDNRIAVVYDTTANILSITGRQDYAKQLLDLFSPANKFVKQSTVPAQGSTPVKSNKTAGTDNQSAPITVTEFGKRAKLFVSPDRITRRNDYKPVATVFASSKGALMTTDEIYPPQTVKKRPLQPVTPVDEEYSGDVIYPPQRVQKRRLPSYGESELSSQQPPQKPIAMFPQSPQKRALMQQTEHSADNVKAVGIAISVAGRSPSAQPRKAVISFGSEDDTSRSAGEFKINTRGQGGTNASTPAVSNSGSASEQPKRKRGRPPKANLQQAQSNQFGEPAEKRKRGRPPKASKASNDYVAVPTSASAESSADVAAFEYKNGYSVKNYPPEALSGAIKRLKEYGKKVTAGGTEFVGTPQEVKSFTVTDSAGQKVLLRYATKRMTLQLQGKRSNLFGEVMSQVSHDSDYSSALENYVEKTGGVGGKKVSDVQNKLKKRLPTAFEFLSEQSRIDFSYGIHDFCQTDLQLSDYSVLLVPAFRGLERFVFDLQRAENIEVKMIGQAFDKDDSGKYILKSGYQKRIRSVVYAEVLVSLYTEYFSQRNFFAHSDNTGGNISRSIPERAGALRIFNHLLDVVEYNAKKLKEIGFSFYK